MKRILLTAGILFLAMAQVSYGQQDPKFTHYMFNQVVYNPAFVGAEMNDQFCANLVHREQWMGFETEDESGAPVTTTFNVHRPFGLKNGNKVGAGLIFANDALGFQRTTTAYGAFSYHYNMGVDGNGKKRWLIGGLNLGILQMGIDGSNLKYIDPNDPTIAWLLEDGNHMALDVGLGLLYKTEKYYVGVSTLHIPQSQIDWFDGQSDGANRLKRHVYINAGYEFEVMPQFLVLKPIALIKFDQAKWQADLGVLAEFNKLVWAGLNYRRGEGMQILAGATVLNKKKGRHYQQLRVGVSYDITFSALSSVSNGSLELMANYCFPINVSAKPPKPEQDVRFLGGYTL